MVEVQALQQHIKNYRNTRQIYIEYSKSGYSKKFFEEHRQVKKEMQEYLIAKQTVEHILGIDHQKRVEEKKQQKEEQR